MPSGQNATLEEVLVDAVGSEAWVRFRFLTPDIGREAGVAAYARVENDFQSLCDMVALPYLAEFDLSADVVVISMMDRVVPFGATDPEATQFFELFRPEDDSCIWQEF